jgi:CRISPR-associated endonuclease/helicase Cas3
MSKILAKSNGVTLREHVLDLLEVLENLQIDSGVRELAGKAILYHDLGKVIYAFQKKVGGDVPEDGIPDVPHSFLSIAFIPENTLRELGEGLSRIFLSAVLYHHWRETYLDYLFGRKKESVCKAYERLLEVGDEIVWLLREEMGDLCEIELNKPLCEYLSHNSIIDSGLVFPPHLISLLPSIILKELNIRDENYKRYIITSGTVMRADRFASYVETAGNKELLKKADKRLERDQIGVVQRYLERISNKVWQLDLLKDCRGENIVLVAPTGAGKTEYALMWSKGKTLFTLPLQSATNMMYERVKNYFGEENVGLLHSDAAVYLFFSSFLKNNFEDREGEVLQIVEQSRFFSHPFVISTGDQVFPSALKYPGYEMIYSILANSYLVIDEIQAYSPEAAAIIVKTAEDVKQLGGHFLIMTATLPGFIRDEILKRAELEEKNIKDVYEDIPQGNLLRNLVKVERSLDPVEKAVEFFKKGCRVLIVRNTVRNAIETYRQLVEKLGKEDVLLIHSRMTLEDRRRIEEILESYRPGAKGRNIILVSTQVVEASMDIDFDILLTDIAPADSLVQRMGRIFRKREWTEEFPNTFIYADSNEKKRKELIAGVYSEEVVSATLKSLKDMLGIEGMFDIEKPFKLDELSKRKWVEETYQALFQGSNYLKKFRETLDVLDSGYSSEKKHEAHRIFRRVASMSIVPENLKEDLKQELKSVSDYFDFRRVTAKYLVDVPLHHIKSGALEPLEVESENEQVLKWASALYVLKGSRYEKGLGIFLEE